MKTSAPTKVCWQHCWLSLDATNPPVITVLPGFEDGTWSGQYKANPLLTPYRGSHRRTEHSKASISWAKAWFTHLRIDSDESLFSRVNQQTYCVLAKARPRLTFSATVASRHPHWTVSWLRRRALSTRRDLRWLMQTGIMASPRSSSLQVSMQHFWIYMHSL